MTHHANYGAFTKALDAGKAAMASPGTFQGAKGCARAYVVFHGLEKPEIKAAEAWAKLQGMTFQRKAHYGLGTALYIGYDNATGHEAAKAEAFAAAVKAAGFGAYADFGED